MPQQIRLTRRLACAVVAVSALSVGLFSSSPAIAADNAVYQAAISSPMRTEGDRKSDAKRKPAEFLAFTKLAPGMKVLDLSAGGGATSELMALVVGNTGEVWAQNGKASANLEKRLAASPQGNLHAVVLGFDNPVPAGISKLDLITINMDYHDIVNTPTDRGAMNKALFDALKPGGYFVVIDNAAKDGSGLSVTNTLHRIDEAALIAEVTKAGFVVDAKSDYLREPSDPREQPFFKMTTPDDKFAVRFVKK
jgi:predicted methyltransferase